MSIFAGKRYEIFWTGYLGSMYWLDVFHLVSNYDLSLQLINLHFSTTWTYVCKTRACFAEILFYILGFGFHLLLLDKLILEDEVGNPSNEGIIYLMRVTG